MSGDAILNLGSNGERTIMEITGKIVELLPKRSGKSANGEWRKQEYVLETDSHYPKKICFMAWGDKIDEFNIKQGDMVTVSVDLESREHNGRWYTDVKAWRILKLADEFEGRDSYEGNVHNEAKQNNHLSIDDDEIPF